MPAYRSLKSNSDYSNPLSAIVDHAVVSIFQAEEEYQKQVFEKILIENQALGGTIGAFKYRFEVFGLIPGKQAMKMDIKRLDTSLEDKIERYLKAKKQMLKDITKVRNGLAVVIAKCRGAQAARDALPDTLVNLIPELRDIERISEEGAILKEHPQLRKQFETAVNLSIDYQARRLIY